MTRLDTRSASLARVWFIACDEARQAVLRFGLWWAAAASVATAVVLSGGSGPPGDATPRVLAGLEESLTSSVILAALISGARLFPAARDTGELDTLLSGPVSRAEFVCGKLWGLYGVVATSAIVVFVGLMGLARVSEVPTQHHVYFLCDTLVSLATSVTYAAAFGLVLRSTVGAALGVMVVAMARGALFSSGVGPEGFLAQVAVAIAGVPLGFDVGAVCFEGRELPPSVSLPYVLESWLHSFIASALCLTLAYGVWSRRDAAL